MTNHSLTQKFLPPSPPRTKDHYLDLAAQHPAGPRFYECGICSAWHPTVWDGDCREDAARFFPEDFDERFGQDSWEEVPMAGGEDDA